MFRQIIHFLTVSFIVASPVFADSITLNSGRVMEGIVIQEDSQRVVVQLNYGTMTVPRSIIQEIKKVPPPQVQAQNTPPGSTLVVPRIPSWAVLVNQLARQTWAANLQQIPATVIDKGVLKNVPYMSFRCGLDYEVNVYGDPDSPCCIEIGIYRNLLKDEKAKQNCIELMACVLADHTDAAIVRALNQKQDLVVRGDVTFEVTPETSEDAYGGWWISVYNVKNLDSSRANERELAAISVPTGPARTVSVSTPISSVSAVSTPTPSPGSWTPSDMTTARPSSTGRVYVRGYYRKDGTYVSGYTRRK